jgi:hypothetical protein
MENDKLILVKNAADANIKKALQDFCNMYNEDHLQAEPRLIPLPGSDFAIIFPNDIDFEIYCYFINYLRYPMDVTLPPDITGWATTKKGDEWINEKNVNKKVMLFVPADDDEFDNVYITTSEDTGYKLGFSVGDQKELKSPKQTYIDPPYEIAALNKNEFEDFR